MNSAVALPRYSFGAEIANAVTHGLGVLLAIAGLAVLSALAAVPAGGLALLAAGGIAHTVGVIFYKWRRLPYNHAVWHGFVLAGSALHFFAVLLYVIPWLAAA